MKKFILLFSVFGLFALVGSVSASTANIIQPAEDVTYNENIIVTSDYSITAEGPGYFQGGLHIDSVTFFNGTAVNNSTTDDGEDIPFTIGDNARIDGEIFRTEVGGDNPIKLADSIKPQTTAIYDLGTSSNRFRNIYLEGNITTNGGIDITSEDVTITNGGLSITNGNLIGAGIVSSENIMNNSITGDDISTSADLSVENIGYSSAQTRYWSISGNSFLPIDDSTTYTINLNKSYLSSTSNYMLAPVNLPNGAVVTSLRVHYYDNNAAAFTTRLYRDNKNSEDDSDLMASVATSTNDTDWHTSSDSSIDDATIDNSVYAYYVRISSLFVNLRLGGVDILYTVTNPLP
ncbi:MAG: hypothetical protein HQ538_04395 [Parcubacteria group bacterium]|nr:hypothetical protein [Parcubacteria group bacterium]